MLLTTLIASWIKKCNYVERINTVDRYVQKLTRLRWQIKDILSQDILDRIAYKSYIKTYQVEIIDMLSTSPPITPEEYKYTVYILTKYYPEVVKDTHPWYTKKGDKYVITSFGYDVLNTYWFVKYRSTASKFFSLYYCKSSYCYPPIKKSIFWRISTML